MVAVNPADPCTIVIFGASGDLTHRLLIPSLYNLAEMGLLSDRVAIIGLARSESTVEQLKEKFRDAIESAEGHPVDAALFDRTMQHLSYIAADFNDESAWQRLSDELAAMAEAIQTRNVLFYLAIAPEQFLSVCEHLAQRGLLDERDGWKRVIIEKPFGTDLASARELNRRLRAVMKEHQIYRIDHYLGKETVQNILVFRFGNGVFEPIWNRRYVDHVQITVAETLGVEMRGSYYDQAGALRDMVPNHLFQILTLTAMEPTSSLEANALHNEQVKVLEAIEPLSMRECSKTSVRAQYTGGTVGGSTVPPYRVEPRVNPASKTETYVAFRIAVDNWRWAGVPFYLRTGKRLANKKSEVVIQFKQPPLALFRGASMAAPEPNLLVISIQPEETIRLRFAAKLPGAELTTSPVDMQFNYGDYFGVEHHTGYETLLYDAMTGDRRMYKRADIVEAGWAIVDPILMAWAHGECGLASYPAGSDGPRQADDLLAREARQWRPL